jgi:hypothetical protein
LKVEFLESPRYALASENEATKPAVALRRHDAESFAHQTDEAEEVRQAQKVKTRARFKPPFFSLPL